MNLKEFFKTINDEGSAVLAGDFMIEVTDTVNVPDLEDSSVTYGNLDTKTKKCKRLESCVLYVDMRDSSKISADNEPQILAKIYSSFVTSMIACGRYFGGHIRNIIGDRVMVVFDRSNCFTKAVDTAILMNSVNQHILNKQIKNITFKAGIGIDYGKMLVTKAGTVRHGAEKEFYRSLVWLGHPANVASKLTDLACKPIHMEKEIRQGNYYPVIDQWAWRTRTFEQFVDDLDTTSSNFLCHKDRHFRSFYKARTLYSYLAGEYPPILITQAVYEGFCEENQEEESNSWWYRKDVAVEGYSLQVYGGDIIFKSVSE